MDPNTPIEDTVGALAELVKEEKVKYVGLSGCFAETLRRSSYCRSSIAYSPLGHGFQTGKYKSLDDFEPDDLEEQYHVFKGDEFITILNTRRIKKF
ncbi:hypothetical protein RhiirB3_444991 [Rhizophagus irregularis]|nr:hypothetical protein RhiirB3_444991 [Rhizophagus irregularis]